MRNKIIFAMLLAGLGLGKVSGTSPAVDVLPIHTQPIFGAPSPADTSICVPPAPSVARALTQGACGFVGTLGFCLGVHSCTKRSLFLGICSVLGAYGLGFAIDAMMSPTSKLSASDILFFQDVGAFPAILINLALVCVPIWRRYFGPKNVSKKPCEECIREAHLAELRKKEPDVDYIDRWLPCGHKCLVLDGIKVGNDTFLKLFLLMNPKNEVYKIHTSRRHFENKSNANALGEQIKNS